MTSSGPSTMNSTPRTVTACHCPVGISSHIARPGYPPAIDLINAQYYNEIPPGTPVQSVGQCLSDELMTKPYSSRPPSTPGKNRVAAVSLRTFYLNLTPVVYFEQPLGSQFPVHFDRKLPTHQVRLIIVLVPHAQWHRLIHSIRLRFDGVLRLPQQARHWRSLFIGRLLR